MPAPSPELTWLSIIASFVAVVTAVINLFLVWRNRRRIEIKTVNALIYYETWKKWDIDKVAQNPPLGRPYWIKEGDCRRAFIVLEFAIKNEYPSDVTIGRFAIDGWMFSDHYTRSDYAYLRDYRVFDLYTHNPIGLDSFWKIPPKSSIGLRVEILENTDGPNWVSNHSRYAIRLPTAYNVDYLVDGSKHHSKIRFPSPPKTSDPDLSHIHHWGDLLNDRNLVSAYGAPLPQGIELPSWRGPSRLGFWYANSRYRLGLRWKSIELAITKRLK